MLATDQDHIFFINHRDPLSLLRLSRYLTLEYREMGGDMIVRNSYSDIWLEQITTHTKDKGVLEAADLFNNKRFDSLVKDFILKKVWVTDPEWFTRHIEYLESPVFKSFITFWLNDVYQTPKQIESIKKLSQFNRNHFLFANPNIQKEWETYGNYFHTSSFNPAGPASFLDANDPVEFPDRIAFTDLWEECPVVPEEVIEKILLDISFKNARECAHALTLNEALEDSDLAPFKKPVTQFLKNKSESFKSSLDVFNELKKTFPEDAGKIIQGNLWAKLFHYGRKLSRLDNITLILLLYRENVLDVYGDMYQWSKWGISSIPFKGALRLEDHLRSHHLHLYLPPLNNEGYCSSELFEITACGRVPVCFNTKNVHDYFDSSAIFNTNDTTSLITWIKDHLAKPTLLEEKGKLLRQLTKEKHLWTHRLTKWGQL